MLQYPIFVTIDTNAFDATKYDFGENSPLQLLTNYVSNGKIKVVLSDIVIREAKKHIGKQIENVCGTARKLRAEVLKASTEHLISYVGLNRLLELVSDKKALVDKSVEIFDKYINDINAEILRTDLIDLKAVIDDYFEIRPPFEAGEKKRKEFPDAFIAYQIRTRFKENEIVAIVSNDKGFKEACQQTKNHLFFDSLSALFDTITKEEEAAYTETMNLLCELQYQINSEVLEHIKSHENINVTGLSYDKDGIVSGFDYEEFCLQNIQDISFRLHFVDEISDRISVATLVFEANIAVDCYYGDYDNAPWDSETKDYVFVETVKMREEHHARFGCRISLNREKKSFKIFPFTVILGGDSRTNIYRIMD